MIVLKDIQLLRQNKVLLNDTSVTLFPKHKIGIVGTNGCGKSSLLALLQHKIEPDQGDVRYPESWEVTSIAQDIKQEALQQVALEYVIDGDQDYRQLEYNIAQAQEQESQNLAELHGQMHAIDGYRIQARASTLLAGLGFSQHAQAQTVGSFSGGWRIRLSLARALLCRSDLLLLDEPTNHLDLDAVIWLENWLKSYEGTLILISHDRDFLDQVVDEIVHIEQQALHHYQGNYSSFERIRAERLNQQQAQFEKQQQERAHIESFINRFKAKASKAKQAQSRIKALNRMENLVAVHQSNPFSMYFLEPEKLPMPLVTMEQISLGYGDKIILKDIKLNLTPGARIGLLGRNGAGKSTLIKLLAGQIQPLTGLYEPSEGLKIGYFSQHQLETLYANTSPLEHLQKLSPNEKEQPLRNFLGQYGFQGDQALTPIDHFSGGEKARLALALIVWQKPNLLLLDEPTNHLDLEMREALTLALQTFSGAMLIVSHDRYLLNTTCDTYYLVDRQKVQPFSGDLKDYHTWLLAQAVPETIATTTTAKTTRKDEKKIQAQLRQKLSPLTKKQSRLEQDIADCEKQLQDLEISLADTTLYQVEHKVQLATLHRQQRTVQEQLETYELQWLTLQEDIELIRQKFNAESKE